MVDDTFTVNRKRTLALLDEIIAAGLNCFEFTGGVRADTLDETLVAKDARGQFQAGHSGSRKRQPAYPEDDSQG